MGAVVTQGTDRSTAVTINALSGQITTHNASLAAAGEAKFTVNNSLVAANDVPLLAIKTDSTTGTTFFYVSDVSAGSFEITATNLHAATADTSASIINFVILKGVAS